jgi:hypothetical protein
MPDLPGHHAAQSSFIGAVPSDRGTHFRVWAPIAHKVEVVFEGTLLNIHLKLKRTATLPALFRPRVPGTAIDSSWMAGKPYPIPPHDTSPKDHTDHLKLLILAPMSGAMANPAGPAFLSKDRYFTSCISAPLRHKGPIFRRSLSSLVYGTLELPFLNVCRWLSSPEM